MSKIEAQLLKFEKCLELVAPYAKYALAANLVVVGALITLMVVGGSNMTIFDIPKVF
ncbi:MAG: hypothetical protein AAB597_02200 [Patescibacteria group bacterium]